ncbi:MAG: cysteine desulfurase family protein [Patescibacteria group bacterium]
MFRKFLVPKKKRLYLDMAAATPVRKGVLEAMQPYFAEQFGNPSAIHAEGRQAKVAISEAREKLARLLHIRPEGVYFTGSGTEANNTAIYGYVRHLLEEEGKSFSDLTIISTKLEHPSVIEVLKHLEDQGVTVAWVNVDEAGKVDEKHLSELLDEKVVLVSLAYVNSEVGVVQPVRRIARAIKKYNQEQDMNILLHADAAQAPLWLSCDMDQLGVDMMTLDAGKCFGPKGMGVLALRRGVSVKGVILGGGQETGVRAGTENTALIVGGVEAFSLAQGNYEMRASETKELRDYFISELQQAIPEVVLNGPVGLDRVANNVNISIPGLDTEYAVVVLDSKGVAASTKSACSGAGGGESVVVKTITGDAARATSTIRFTLGSELSKSDIDYVVKTLKEHVTKATSI